MTTSRSILPGRLAWIIVGASSLSLYLRSTIPVSAFGDAIHDDALFVRLASSLLNGQWLGDYDQQTLIKGAFYPAFISGVHWLGLPLKVAEQIVFLATVGFTTLTLRRLRLPPVLCTLVFVLLALNPVLWHPVSARVLRDGLYMSLGLAVFALAASLLFGDRKPENSRLGGAAVAGVFGLLFAAYWLTREESPWLYPALAVLVTGALVRLLITWRTQGTSPVQAIDARSLALKIAAASCTFILIVGTVASLNYIHYGVFLTNEIREGTYSSGYAALSRIEPRKWQRYQLFPDDVAAKAFKVSPAAAELMPGLARTQSWRSTNCRNNQLDPCPTGPGGWFVWALRDAIGAAGYYNSAQRAQEYSERLAAEINAACNNKLIACSGVSRSMAPPFRREYVSPIIASTIKGIAILLGLFDVAIGAGPSNGSREQVQHFNTLTGPSTPFADVQREVLASGWVASSVCLPKLAFVNESGPEFAVRLKYAPADDVVAHFAQKGKALKALRFALRTDCYGQECKLAMFGCDPKPRYLNVSSLKPGPQADVADAAIFLDKVSTTIEAPLRSTEDAVAGIIPLLIMKTWTSGYYLALQVLFALGTIGFFIAVLRVGGLYPLMPLYSVALAALAAVATRCVMVAFIDVSLWPAMNALYLMPATPFIVIYSLVGCYLGTSGLTLQTIPAR